MAELLGNTGLSAAQREMLDIVQSSGEALLGVINDILDVSVVEAGKLRLAPKPMDLCAMVEDVAALLDARARAKGFEVVVRFRPDLPTMVRADAGRLRQVVTNLVGNAVKFTDQGHVLIDVDGEASGETCRYVISVEDTGVGIPDDKLDAVFGMFEQVDMSSTRKFEGAGLGLHICKRIMEAMGGTLTVQSRLGAGSTFRTTVELPVCADIAPRTPAASLQGRRILIVDDKPVNRMILEERARSWGALSVSAEGAADALVALRRSVEADEPFDVAILDLQMPEMNGSQLAREIRSGASTKDLPLILLTSVDYGEHLASELFDHCLTKPVRSAALEQMVRGLLGSEPAAAPPQAPAPAAVPVRAETRVRRALPAAPAPPPPAPEPVLAEAPPSKPQPAEAATPVESACGRTRILIADDNAVNVRVVTSLLPDEYELFVANDGEEAVRLFQRCKPAVVLMDLLMPKLDGIEAAREIRKLPGGAHTPIIALSADVVEETVARCHAAGLDGHVAKPIRTQELLETLRRFCAPQPAAEEASAQQARSG